MTPQRPALAEVLAALTGHSGPPLSAMPWEAYTGRPESMHGCGATTELLPWGAGASLLVSGVKVPFGIARWLHASPAEAAEALATARLWPWDLGDDPTRWWCPTFAAVYDCPDCDDGAHTAPPTLAALVAVASLGARQLARYVHLAGEIARVVTYGNARVVWRAMTREAIVSWAMERRGKTCRSTADLVLAMSTEGVLNPSYLALPHAMPWAHALRALAGGEGDTPQPTGVHLVGLDASRIVLAVEAI